MADCDKKKMDNRFFFLHRRDQDLWAVWRVVMAALAADRAVLPVKEDALANVDLHVTFCRPARLAGTVAERAL